MSNKKNNTEFYQTAVSEIGLLPKNEFLFIGTTAVNNNYANFFSEYHHSINLFGATEILEYLVADNQPLPALIILDIPLNNKELAAFKTWLQQSVNTHIPVVYNEAALKPEEIKEVQKFKLVDDVVNLSSNYNKLHIKAKFLKAAATSHTETAVHSDEFKSMGISMFKRTVDVTLSLTAIIFFLPLFLLIAIAIRLESRGPIFYSAVRAGRGFKIFKFYKFRTMVVDADKKLAELAKSNLYATENNNGPSFFKVKNDPRITKVGAFLRNSSLDELPQLLNVLKGDMSIVGNRPLPLYEATSLTTDEWAERFMAPAGITGLWQISKRGKEEMSNEERIQLDINYARTHSIKGDLKIMLQTPTALIQKTNV